MSQAFFKIPELNPLHFTDVAINQLPQYNYKHFSDYQFRDTIRFWEYDCGEWYQPWQLNDAIRLHILSEVGPVKFTLLDEWNHAIYVQNMQQVAVSFYNPTMFIYELDLDLSIFEPGIYRAQLEFGSPVLARVHSNPLEFNESLPYTLRTEYKHRRYLDDVYFETGWSPMIRTWGTLDYEEPGSVNKLFLNQGYDLTTVNVKTFNTWRFYTGGPEGIPLFMIPKFNEIFRCSELSIEGRFYTKAAEGTNWVKKDEQDYPMKGWSIELRDRFNRPSKIWEVDTEQPLPGGSGGQNQGAAIVAAIVVETKGFVSDDAGGSFYTVPDIE